ncbi:alpha/beta hydrolase [Gemmatimonas sp.]|jgi:pimeloyl-ACP methyl ester carboxylesterase|uniref:alpha/beta hydrolase n=2 Tax=Gemmatimonas sp. TaxID=1962908 RepID=UPI0022C9C61D|nr:alpha/beta hydrolase [Gemmatimonas sp.]MCA2983401.1 alpha/beta fold hydrolase [Gemmatimonas sp.]MCA2988027.1 alpha/beta fold hydrolase [Gemmatimonas sp.]MCA2990252.1 alpha/beta fold hydrolase [Gemmatimonas sp.]MCA2996785.1 alpha/beta fold hydrolase [Gemmatimonas sp.]MCE2954993.1 alpha/beta hydrolase [Gemmatimonas sp.]
MLNGLYTLLSQPFGGALLGGVLLVLGGLVALATRRLGRALRLVALAPALIGVVLTAMGIKGGLDQQRAMAAVPPPGRLVDVGGYRLHLLAEGNARGGATVVWIPGAHEQGNALYHLHRAMRGETRSLLFDRAGTGWSDPGPFPRRTRVEAEELETLLRRAGEPGPFVLVGHSYGGLLAANYARRYPTRTAAVVLLDATPPDAFVYAPVFGAAAAQGLVMQGRLTGMRAAFGLWTPRPRPGPNAPPFVRARDTLLADVREAMNGGMARAANAFASASIFEEFTAPVVGREAPDLVVYDGELDSLPVFVVIPRGGVDEEIRPLRLPAALERRALGFFPRSRVRYLAVSNRAELIHPPAGASHNFPYEYPDTVIGAVRRALGYALPRDTTR